MGSALACGFVFPCERVAVDLARTENGGISQDWLRSGAKRSPKPATPRQASLSCRVSGSGVPGVVLRLSRAGMASSLAAPRAGSGIVPGDLPLL